MEADLGDGTGDEPVAEAFHQPQATGTRTPLATGPGAAHLPGWPDRPDRSLARPAGREDRADFGAAWPAGLPGA